MYVIYGAGAIKEVSIGRLTPNYGFFNPCTQRLVAIKEVNIGHLNLWTRIRFFNQGEEKMSGVSVRLVNKLA